MSLVANNAPPPNLFARRAVRLDVRTPLCPVGCIRVQRLVRRYNNGILSKAYWVTFSAASVIRVDLSWICQLRFGLLDPLANQREFALKQKVSIQNIRVFDLQ